MHTCDRVAANKRIRNMNLSLRLASDYHTLKLSLKPHRALFLSSIGGPAISTPPCEPQFVCHDSDHLGRLQN